MARGKSTKENAKIIERQIQALQMRRSGFSYRKIGARLGITHVQARADVLKALEARKQDRDVEADLLVQLELERLDMLLEGLYRMAEVGNPLAVEKFLKVSESRRKLLGLDAPAKTYNFNVEIVAKAWAAIEESGVDPVEAFNRIIQKAHADSG